MRTPRVDLTHEEVRRLFDYCPQSGRLLWKCASPRHQYSVGKEAGGVHWEGYRRLAVRKKHYLAHRVIWLHYYGEWPNGIIDHINRNRSDNRIENLRVVSDKESSRNKRPRSEWRYRPAGMSRAAFANHLRGLGNV